jgi:acetyl esterase/lipase
MPPIDYSSIDNFKKMIEERSKADIAALGSPPSSVRQSEHQFIARDGKKIRAILYQPTSPPQTGSPLIVMFHGGGFCVGAPEGEELSCRSFVQAFGATCVSAAYRLAPEYPFPYAPNDAFDALKWAIANAKSFGADPSVGFVIGGTSAGANIAAVLAHLARDEGLSPPLTGQYLSVPCIVAESLMPDKYKHLSLSYEQNKDALVIPKAAVDMITAGYAPDNHSPLINVLAAPKGHANLPPAYFQICGMDPFRDDGLIYEKILREENGIKTRMDVYPGLPHHFWGAFPMLKSSNKPREDMVQGFGWLLGMKPNLEAMNTDAKEAVVDP